jgi:hypothetical protein
MLISKVSKGKKGKKGKKENKIVNLNWLTAEVRNLACLYFNLKLYA